MPITYAIGQRLTASLLQTLANGTVNKPRVRLVQQATQALAAATNVTITFGVGSELIDTDNYHDESTNNTRITPTVAGYYKVWGGVHFASAATTFLQVNILLNGNPQPGQSRQGSTGTGQKSTHHSPVTLLMNGTTDYVELRANSTIATSTDASGSTASYLELEFDRPA